MRKKRFENQNLLKNIIESKDVVKKSEVEINKQLDYMTISQNDKKLQKSQDDYKNFI